MKATSRIGIIAALGAVSWLAATAAMAGTFNQPGNTLISDQFNNRVIEIDRQGQIVWSFGLGPRDFTANSIVGVNDAERIGRNTLMAGTGIPLASISSAKSLRAARTTGWSWRIRTAKSSGNTERSAPEAPGPIS
jgi:hypothetical protein